PLRFGEGGRRREGWRGRSQGLRRCFREVVMGKIEGIQRFLRHGMAGSRWSSRAFPPGSLVRLEAALDREERGYEGEVCFVVEPALDWWRLLRGMTPRERAWELFAQLNLWDTEKNSGVLLYVLLADRSIELVADRAIQRLVGDSGWEAICSGMEAEFRRERFLEGSLEAIRAVAGQLRRHFPAEAGKDSPPSEGSAALERGSTVSDGETNP
ncbi:MAG: TPM domain-containing protein, partial [Methylacidiphilaceae bacterium]|nr:TPM domain-containing protein [Candidatus Methylacidiphilaceae bacterium]